MIHDLYYYYYYYYFDSYTNGIGEAISLRYNRMTPPGI